MLVLAIFLLFLGIFSVLRKLFNDEFEKRPEKSIRASAIWGEDAIFRCALHVEFFGRLAYVD